MKKQLNSIYVYLDHNVLVRIFEDEKVKNIELLSNLNLLFKSKKFIPCYSFFGLIELVKSNDKIQVLKILKILSSFENLHYYDLSNNVIIAHSNDECINFFLLALLGFGNECLKKELLTDEVLQINTNQIKLLKEINVENILKKMNLGVLVEKLGIKKGIYNDLSLEDFTEIISLNYNKFLEETLDIEDRNKFPKELFGEKFFNDEAGFDSIDLEVAKSLIAEFSGYGQKKYKKVNMMNSLVDSFYYTMCNNHLDLIITEDQILMKKINKNCKNGKAISIEVVNLLVTKIKTTN